MPSPRLDDAKRAIAIANNYPLSQKYSELRRTHSDYNRARMDENEALFEGGEKFYAELNKAGNTFLIKREAEKQSGGGNIAPIDTRVENPESARQAAIGNISPDTYALRKKYVQYVPLVAGLIDFICKSVLSSAPLIVATKQKKTPGMYDKIARAFSFFNVNGEDNDPDIQYYHALNANADGAGNSLLNGIDVMLRDICVHGRAFAGVRFPASNATSELERVNSGGNDGVMCYFPAIECDDWEVNANGLCKLRRHFFDMDRSNPTIQPDTKTERWVFITAAASYIYEINWTKAEQTFTPPQPDDIVQLVDVQPNSLGVMPVRMTDLKIKVMERLRPTIETQINLDCDLRWGIQSIVYALMFIMSKKQIATISPDQMAVQLDVGDSVSIAQPSASILAPIYEAIDRNRDARFEVVMAMILKSATMASNGRQSADAKRMDFNTFEVFLKVFSEPLRQVLQWQLSLIQKARNKDGVLVNVLGLTDFDIESVTAMLDNATKFLALDGITDTMKKSTLLRVFQAVNPTASSEQIETVINEIQSAPKPTPTPQPTR